LSAALSCKWQTDLNVLIDMSAESALEENGEEFIYLKRNVIGNWHYFKDFNWLLQEC